MESDDPVGLDAFRDVFLLAWLEAVHQYGMDAAQEALHQLHKMNCLECNALNRAPMDGSES